MHELAIAESIVKTVHDQIERNGLGKVLAVGMRIGDLTDVVPEALEFGFEAITRDTVLGDAKLLIEKVPIQGRCRGCGNDFQICDFTFICPSCDSRDIDLTHGNELDLAYIEVADEDST